MSDNATNIKKTITTDTGFSDPNAELPKPEYWGGSSINLAASGRTRNDLWTGGYFLQEPVELFHQDIMTIKYRKLKVVTS